MVARFSGQRKSDDGKQLHCCWDYMYIVARGESLKTCL